MPLARTRAERDARRDPRPSIEERYKGRDDYLQRIRTAATALVKERFILEQDVEDVVQRATRHWEYVTTRDADQLSVGTGPDGMTPPVRPGAAARAPCAAPDRRRQRAADCASR